MSPSVDPPAVQSSTTPDSLSKQGSNWLPDEIWLIIVALTVNPYDILLIEERVRYATDVPISEININNNNIREMLDLCTVSQTFREGIRLGCRKSFSGHLYFWCGDFTPEACTFVKKKLASHVKKLSIHISTAPYESMNAFRSDWSQFIRSGGFLKLNKLRVFAPLVDDPERDTSSSEEEMDEKALEHAARVRNTIAASGFNLDPAQYRFRMCVYIQEVDPHMAPHIDELESQGSTGHTLAEEWRTECDVPISCRQMKWLWTIEPKPAPT